MKKILIIHLAILMAVCTAHAQNPIDENSLPAPGITYQEGPGNNNSLSWAYPYGVKLTVWRNTHRNFEIVSTGKSVSATLALRTYNGELSSWTAWRTLLTRDDHRRLVFPVTSSFSKSVSEYNGDLLLQSANSGLLGNYGASISFSKLSGGLTKRAAIASKQTGNDVDHVGLSFLTHGNVGGSDLIESMVITGDGNVAIGTAQADAKLTVKGSVHAEEVRVDLSVPGPDYVFEPDYNLITLEKTKAYIAENKHLPEIPSAKEMEAEGIELGDMNMLLLKKIEEMTLHQIALMEELKALKAKVEKLEK
ncbi:MAG: hypothetical protein WBA74_11245 [Cyclobacteriaceae bacterium]